MNTIGPPVDVPITGLIGHRKWQNTLLGEVLEIQKGYSIALNLTDEDKFSHA